MICKIEDAQYGIQMFVYFEIKPDGTPDYDQMDNADAKMAAEDGIGKELYYCRGCGDEFPNFERLKDHTEQEGKE